MVGLAAITGTEGMIGMGGSCWIVALSLFTIAIGEMMASPTSQEYVGRIAPDERVVLFNCATGLKYPMPDAGTRIDLNQPIDYEAMKRV